MSEREETNSVEKVKACHNRNKGKKGNIYEAYSNAALAVEAGKKLRRRATFTAE